MRALRIALVHDWLTGTRGGERVLAQLVDHLPEAELFTLFHVPGRVPAAIEARPIHESPLARLPGARHHYRKLLPLHPWAARQLDLSGFDFVLSTSHAFAKSVAVPPGVPHLSYCFTPMRYVWDQADAYLGRGWRRRLATPLVHWLRHFDRTHAGPESVTRFCAISSEVAQRIERHYGRVARVVAPPVDLSWIERASAPPEDFYLMVGGFVPYKREALVVEAFRRSGRRLVVAGDGPTRPALERSAPPNVTFTGRIEDAELASLYRRARALVYPQLEDFGLVAVEAQGAGRPVIAFGAGGVLDTVVPLQPHQEAGSRRPQSAPTGIFFDRPEPESLELALERFEKNEPRFEPARIRAHAERFAPSRFFEALDDEIRRTQEDCA